MGTRSLTFVYENHEGVDGKPVVNLYRQFDGYPDGHGLELAEFLNSIVEVVNGISDRNRRIANGMGCLAAQMVVHFKQEVGGFYLYPTDATDCGQDYEYHVYKDRVVVRNYEGEIFDGGWEDFEIFCQEAKNG